MRKENGRSMIEMLGVLAIIGVISIGGISLYRRAVDTHKANSIFDDVNRFEFVISERVFRTPRGFIDKADFKPISGFDMTAYNEPELSSHHISVAAVPKSVCRIVLDKGEEDYVMFANNLMFEGDSSICTQDLNEMRFYFGDTSDLCSFPAPNTDQFACSNDCLCDNDRVCKPDIYNPDSIPKMTEETVCCPKDNDIVACNGKCIEECGPSKTLDRKTCQCVCADSMKQMDENGNCVCKTSGSSVALVEDEDGKCGCEDARYIWVASMNKCSFLNCPVEGGNCDLDGRGCGYQCTNVGDATTVTCHTGICRADLCTASGRTFEQLPKPVSGYYWGCHFPNTNCYSTRVNSYFYCFNDSSAIQGACCSANADLECTVGLCDQSYCQERFGSGATYGQALNYGGCLFLNGSVQCYPTNSDRTNWNCFRGSTSCATDCTTPPNCGTCSDICSGVGKADSNGRCCVTVGTKEICQNGRTYSFKNGSSYDSCGQDCTYEGLTKQEDGTYTATSISCRTGHCQAPTCTDNSWSYGKVDSNWWGCIKNGIGCYIAKNSGPYRCPSCGTRCSTIDNSNCAQWSAKQCAPMVTKNNITKPACIYSQVISATDVSDTLYDCWCLGDVVYDETDTNQTTPYCCEIGQIVRGGACVVNQ